MKRKAKLYLLDKLRVAAGHNPPKNGTTHQLFLALAEELLLAEALRYTMFSYICSYLNTTSPKKRGDVNLL